MLKNYCICLLLLFITVQNSFGQEKCDCLSALDEISEHIKNAKSYKVQIKKGKKTEEFDQWKLKIEEEIMKDSMIHFFCQAYLQKYISFISDTHNQIYKIPENIDQAVPDYHKQVDPNRNYQDGISGKYYAGKYEVSVIPQENEIWYGVLLNEDLKHWKKGKIRFILKRKEDQKFEMFEYFSNGFLMYYNEVEIIEGRISKTYWNKDNKLNFITSYDSNFVFKNINRNIDYIGIKTLRRYTKEIQEGNSFYDYYLPKLLKDVLIVDLRNNGGGSPKQAERLLAAIKDNQTIKKIFVLINFKTGSAAELTTLELLKDDRTVVVGENSKGMLAYSYGNASYSAITKCGEYQMSFTVNTTKKEYLPLENKGITPDLKLDNQEDWIEQLKHYLQKEYDL